MNTSLYACGPPSWLPGILKRVSQTPVATRQVFRVILFTAGKYITMTIRSIMLFGAPLTAALLYLLLRHAGIEYVIAITAAITVLTAIWWVTETISIPATSLIPFFAFPLANVLTHREAAAGLGSPVILLLMGGFMLARSLEKSGVHRRFALAILHTVGGSGKRIVFAFMLTAALLSMWISNTATTLILIPIALAVLKQVENKALSVAVVLGVAYSASLGGVATLIGTPPNIIFAGIYSEFTGMDYTFVQWMKIGLPVVLCGLPLMALWLTRKVRWRETLELPAADPWQVNEARVLAVFGITIVLWITRSEPFGGWSGLLGTPDVGDATVALAAVVVMFILPSGKGDNLLDWKTAVDIPWGMLLLFASGITIARAFSSSGLAELIAQQLTVLAQLPLPLLLLCICLGVTFLTEITSNTATTTLLMPIFAATALAVGVSPELMMVPAAMSASCAFMLPVATVPNAIVFGTGHVTIREMVREGLALNLILALVIAMVCYAGLAT